MTDQAAEEQQTPQVLDDSGGETFTSENLHLAEGDLVLDGSTARVQLQTQTSLPFWQRFIDDLFPSRTQREATARQRLQGLDDAIALYPETTVNYVLRGEVYLELRQDELAALDFRRAFEMAAREVEHNTWGIVAQTLQDRALHGLNQAQRRLARKRNPISSLNRVGGQEA